MHLEPEEQAFLNGDAGGGVGTAMRILVDMAEILGAERFIPIVSAHIDGCLYHGDSGVDFAERLRDQGARVRVPTTLNVGGLDLLHPGRVQGDPHRRTMAGRQMAAYVEMGCTPTWTCAPYQAGHRPAVGDQVAWGESNAVAFANSVLGARTNRYGDFLDACCAITGRAPLIGLHCDADRRATVVIDVSGLSPQLRNADVFYPVLGSWLGRVVGTRVAVIDGLQGMVTEDRLKAVGAAAASTGAVGLFHVAGETPEAPNLSVALDGKTPDQVITPSVELLRGERDRLSTTAGGHLDAIALGSPHFSLEEFQRLETVRAGRTFQVGVYVCTGRGVLEQAEAQGIADRLRAAGATMIADTCVVVAPILPEPGGVLMTNSGKFAHYTRPNTGYEVVFGSLEDCVESAVAGAVTRDESLWR